MEPLSPRHRDAARVPGLQRFVQRRRGLPNGRAVVGALLLTMAGVGTFAAANHRSDPSAIRYVTVAPGLMEALVCPGFRSVSLLDRGRRLPALNEDRGAYPPVNCPAG